MSKCQFTWFSLAIPSAIILIGIVMFMPLVKTISSSDKPTAVFPSQGGYYDIPRFPEIAVLKLETDTPKTFPASLLFGKYGASKEAKILFSDVKDGISVSYKFPNIIIKPLAGFSGASAFVVSLESRDGMKFTRGVVVKVLKTHRAIFRYKPVSPRVGKIFVAGDFNSWNSSATPLKGPDKKGYYVSAPLKLSQGEYKYKFVVDGNWIPDPENPETLPDGFGGNNSVIRVKGADEASGFWVTISKDSDGKIRVGYVYGESGAPLDEKKPSLIVVTPNSVLSYEKGDYSVIDSLPGDYINYVDIKIPSIGDSNEIRINGKDKSGAQLKEFILKFPSATDDKWENRMIYFAFTDRFFNGDFSNDKPCDDPEVDPSANWFGGDFAGIIAKLREGYFERLGVGALWIAPHIKNPLGAYRDALPPHRKFTGYHGYWPVSFEETDPRFGTIEELKTLVQEAHSRGIKVMLDMVLNHVHQENPLCRAHPEWFSKVTLSDGRKNIRLFDERAEDTWFDEFLPDFDYSKNPAAIDYMVDNCLYWIKASGCDGFRLDAVKHIPTEFWLALRKRIREEIEIPSGRRFYLVGESISSREKIMEYVGFDRLDGQFDFPLYWAIKDVFAWQTKGLDYLAAEVEKSALQYRGSLPSPLVGNHDFARFMSFADGSIPPGSDEKSRSWENRPVSGTRKAHKKLRLALTFLLTQSDCVPMIYYGDEIGMPGAGDPDNRRPMKFKGLTKDERQTFDTVSRLARFRRSSMALSHASPLTGDHRSLFVGENVWAYIKNYFNKEYVLVILNRSDKPLVISSPIRLPSYYQYDYGNKNLWTDVLTGKKLRIDKVPLNIAPMSAMVLSWMAQE